jgi:hypothetical protein
MSMNEVLSTHPQIPFARLTVMHLLPGACIFLLMLLAGYLFPHFGIFPTLPVIFLLVGPIISLLSLILKLT